MTRPVAIAFLGILSSAQPLLAATGGEIAITVTIQQAQVAGVEIRPRPDQRGEPGETLTYRFRLQNTGNGTDRFSLAANSSREWAVALPDGALTGPLVPAPGGRSRETVAVQVTIPLTEPRGTEDVLTVTATSEFDPGVSAQVSVSSTVVVRGAGPP